MAKEQHTGTSGSRAPASLPQAAVNAYRAGQRDQAELICREAVQRQPGNFDAWYLLGALCAERADWEQALDCLSRAVALNSASPYFEHDLGVALSSLGRHAEAIGHFRRAVALQPNFADAHCNLGAAQEARGDIREALASFDRAIAQAPGLARAHSNRGGALLRLRRLDEALASYDRALAIQPRYGLACAKRAVVLLELSRPTEALASLDEALREDPGNWLAEVNRSALLEVLDRFDDALAAARRAVSIAPGSAVAHNALGGVLTVLSQHAKALESFEHAMALDANYAEARWNAALSLLRFGRMREGWALHEWRKRLPRPMGGRLRAGTEWTGSESLSRRTLLVVSEQGLGDTIQFCRFATLAARAGATVVLEAPAPLRSLLSSLEGVTSVVGPDEPLPRIDLACSMMTLPLAFGATLDSLPAEVPYLRADDRRREAWSARLGPREKLRVGLVWSGGVRPDQPELAVTNQRRNIPLALLAPLRHPGIEFFSLQKGPAAEAELARAVEGLWDGPELRNFAALLDDLADTAALIAQLDLVISVDTATAHLAGALGKPVWILNRFDNCWRWLIDRTDSPWYPTARLYRQSRQGDWAGVIEQVQADLHKLVASPAAV